MYVFHLNTLEDSQLFKMSWKTSLDRKRYVGIPRKFWSEIGTGHKYTTLE